MLDETSVRKLTVGAVTADLDGVDLRAVMWRGHPVLNRLYGAVRNEAWHTMPGCVQDLQVEESDQQIDVRFRIDHLSSDAPFEWDGHYVLRSDSILAVMEGRWSRAFATNRTGWCLLHPISHVGGHFHGRLHGQDCADVRLPDVIEPQRVDPDGRVYPAWGPFDQLDINIKGVSICHRFEGDLFETEDQRNWSDASFKTYSTPIRQPWPRRVDAGESVVQRIRIDLADATLPGAEPFDTPTRASRAAQEPLVEAPDVETAAASQTLIFARLDEVAGRSDTAVVLSVVDGLRARINGAQLANARPVMEEAAGAPLWDLEVLATPEIRWESLAEILPGRVPSRLIILPTGAPSGDPLETAPDEWVVRAQAVLGGVIPQIGAGTPHNLAELQRRDLTHSDVVAFAYSPRVHADDPRSVDETMQSYCAMVATARARAGGAAVSVGPLRDPAGLPVEWIARSVQAWVEASADVVCVAAVSELVSAGHLTGLGEAMNNYLVNVAGAGMKGLQ